MTKLLLLQLLLTFVVTVSGFMHYYPPDCSPPKCRYVVNITMEKSGGGVHVVIDANQTKPDTTWTGIGFSKANSTDRMDIIYGGHVRGKPIHVHGLWETGKKLAPLPSLPNTDLSQSNGRLVLRFTHPPHTSNPKDFSFTDNDCYYLVYLPENGKMSDERGGVTLNTRKVHFSDRRLCVRDLKTPGTPGTPTRPWTTTPPGGSDADTRTEGTEVYPRNCKEESCTTTVTWALNLTTKVVKFQVVARQDVNTYTGVGFSLLGKGKGSINAILGYKDKAGKVAVTSAKLQENIDPTISNSQDLQNWKMNYAGGKWTLVFELKINPQNKDEIDLSKKTYFLVLFPGGGTINRENKLGRLLKKPEYSPRKINFVKKEGPSTELDDGEVHTHNMWKYNCRNDDRTCQYRASWIPRHDVVDFTIVARLPTKFKFTGIGLAKKPDLSSVDFIYAKKVDDIDPPLIHHGLITNGSSPEEYVSLALSKNDSYYANDDQVVMTFSHSREPLDDNDISLALDRCYYLVFPYEAGDLNDADLDVVIMKRHYITKKRVCFKPSTPGVFPEDPFATVTPIPTPPQTNKRMCYFANWAPSMPDPVRFLPRDIDPNLCSHIVYCFATIEASRVVPTNDNDTVLMKQINDLKKINRDLKTMLAIGGDDMDIREMSEMLQDDLYRGAFIKSTIKYLRNNGFDGVNLMFKYPGWKKSKPQDKDRFMSLITEMRKAFRLEVLGVDKPRLLISVSVSVLPEIMEKAYNVNELSNEVDCIELMTFDLHGSWENVSRHHSALNAGHRSDKLSMESIVKHWTDLGADRAKLVLGIALYGRGGILEDIEERELGSPLTGPSPPGKYTNSPGILAYYEICMLTRNPDTEQHWIEDQSVPYLVYRPNKVWMGYDNETSVRDKATWIKEEGLGGYYVWISHFDDFKGTFCNRGRFPLIRTLSESFVGKAPRVTAKTMGPVVGDIRIALTTPEEEGEETTTPEGINPTSTMSVAVDKCKNQRNGIKFPVPGEENCHLYIECVNKASRQKSCDQLYFNPKTSRCTAEETLTQERKDECGL